MDSLTLDEAVRMALAARDEAEKLNIKVTISILDPRGDIILVHRMDDALWRSIPISEGKAAASAAWNTPSGDLTERWSQPPFQALSIRENGRLIPWQGALPIRRADETMVGAIGISGAKSELDERVASAGLSAL